MQFTALFAYVLAAASIGSVVATPTASEPVPFYSGDDSVSLAKRSGCGSSGPLGDGHYVWYIVVGCTPGADLYVSLLRECIAR